MNLCKVSSITHEENELGPFYRLELIGGKTNQMNEPMFRIISQTGGDLCPYSFTKRFVKSS